MIFLAGLGFQNNTSLSQRAVRQAPRNALRLSIKYVFILIEKIQSTKELVNDEPFD